MKRSFRVACLAIALACAALQARGEGLGTPNPEDIKHGAVLCAWSIYLAIKETGSRCFPDEDLEFKAALDNSIAHIDQFIIDNAPMTGEQFQHYKQRAIDFTIKFDVCTRDHKMMYEMMRKAGPKEIGDSTARMLAVPRTPAMNPCL
jgi:hypothetical protein